MQGFVGKEEEGERVFERGLRGYVEGRLCRGAVL